MLQNEMIQKLESCGFIPHDHKDHFGCVIPYVYYGYRKVGSEHEYVSLVSYENRFVEAVYERYLNKKNTRSVGRDHKKKEDKYSEFQKRGFSPVTTLLSRDWETLKGQLLSFPT